MNPKKQIYLAPKAIMQEFDTEKGIAQSLASGESGMTDSIDSNTSDWNWQ